MTRTPFAFLLFAALLAVPACQQKQQLTPDLKQTAGSSPISSQGNPEALFVIRALEDTYARWPAANEVADPIYLRDWLAGTRLRLARLHEAAVQQRFDPELQRLLARSLDLARSYQSYLVQVGAINDASVSNAQNADAQAGMDAIGRGFKIYGAAQGIGLPPVHSFAAAVLVSGIEFLWKKFNGDRELDNATRQALYNAADRINNESRELFTRAQVVIEKLAKDNGWGAQAGFDNSQYLPVSQQLGRRPNDPFLWVLDARDIAAAGDASSLLRAAKRCEDAAKKVPDGLAYRGYRAEFLSMAGGFAIQAANAQLEAKRPDRNVGYSDCPVPAGTEAVRLLQDYLAAEPSDPKKLGKRELARAFAFAGRYNEAITAANEAIGFWRDDPWFAYRYARLMSVTGQTAKVKEWLAWSLARGYSEIRIARNDPDMRPFALAYPADFQQLTSVTTHLTIDYDRFGGDDDLFFTNTSPFAITNVVVSPTITQGGRTYYAKYKLQVAYLAPGAKQKFTGAMHIPGNRFDTFNYDVYCDQK